VPKNVGSLEYLTIITEWHELHASLNFYIKNKIKLTKLSMMARKYAEHLADRASMESAIWKAYGDIRVLKERCSNLTKELAPELELVLGFNGVRVS
jgi:hypothetical protein